MYFYAYDSFDKVQRILIVLKLCICVWCKPKFGSGYKRPKNKRPNHKRSIVTKGRNNKISKLQKTESLKIESNKRPSVTLIL